MGSPEVAGAAEASATPTDDTKGEVAEAEAGQTASTLAGPPTDLVPPTPGEAPLVGTIVEHLPTGNYHYLRVAPERGPARWVVTMGGEHREGERVEVRSFGARDDFYSRRLGRRFDTLTFGTVAPLG